MAKLEQRLTPPAAELLVAALTSGDQRMTSALQTLEGAARRDRHGRNEELEALEGLLGAFGGIAEAGSRTALEPTLRHLLARVL